MKNIWLLVAWAALFVLVLILAPRAALIVLVIAGIYWLISSAVASGVRRGGQR
jgi:hypothetical protein